jgi:transposase-like protein
VKSKRFTEQQIIELLKQAKAGVPVKELCRKHGFSDAAFYGWRAKSGGLQGCTHDTAPGRRTGQQQAGVSALQRSGIGHQETSSQEARHAASAGVEAALRWQACPITKSMLQTSLGPAAHTLQP